ncbi:MAG: ATP-binding cassette domain-containing protein, partial [Flavisolibacter sp.]
EWIFRNASMEFKSGSSYAITGPNGSGKSTFLQVAGSMIQLNEGTITYQIPSLQIKAEEIYNKISFCAPYLDIIEEMTFLEFLEFHNQFKPFVNGISKNEIINITGLKKSAGKQIRYYSSGMKQRVKLAQSIFSDTEIVLLDEPCNNLDHNGIELYLKLVSDYCRNRLVIISSNDEKEYCFCNTIIEIQKLKYNSAISHHDNG